MFHVVLSFITALALTYLIIPSVIKIGIEKGLTDKPGKRRAHVVETPSLGGIGIFLGMLFSIIMWTPFEQFEDLQYILCGMLILFMIGVKDDISPIPAKRKLVGQILAASILVFKSDVVLTNLYGILGFTTLPYWLAAAISIFIIIVIVNSFNLIDGINGLSGGVTCVVCGIFGTWFLLTENMGLAILSFSTLGATLAFLKYNVPDGKIFMGDTGSLILGTMISVLTIRFIELQVNLPVDHPYFYRAAPAMAVSILILPLFDTLRVFTIRALRGRSPLSPDRNHIHHLLIDSGLSHVQASGILIAVNCVFILVAAKLQSFGNNYLMLLLLFIAVGMTMALQVRVSKVRRRKAQAG